MQTDTQKTDWTDLIHSREIYSIGIGKSKPEPEPEPQEKVYRQDIQDILDAVEKINPEIKHNKPDHDKLTDEDRKRLCTRNSGLFGMSKGIDGYVKMHPLNCNKCEKCIEANTLKLKDRVEGIVSIEDASDKLGQWRCKIVDEGTEAQSLKKHIKRNQNDTRFDCTSSEPGKREIWAYIEDEVGKDMDKVYGEVSDPKSIDFKALYARNRESGKSFSVGSAYKKKGLGVKKGDTERLQIPQIIVKDVSRQDEAEDIIHKTNYVELAGTPEKAKKLYTYQFKFVLKELKKANIEIAAIKMTYYNMAKEQLLEEWNTNVRYWMSISSSKPKNKGGEVDSTTHLIFPKSSKKNEPVVN